MDKYFNKKGLKGSRNIMHNVGPAFFQNTAKGVNYFEITFAIEIDG